MRAHLEGYASLPADLIKAYGGAESFEAALIEAALIEGRCSRSGLGADD